LQRKATALEVVGRDDWGKSREIPEVGGVRKTRRVDRWAEESDLRCRFGGGANLARRKSFGGVVPF